MIRVLVVDDSPTARRMLSLLIDSQPDMEVAGTAANGAEALERAAELRPDVVTLDLVMPVMSGFEALIRLRKSSDAAVLVVSGGLREGDESIPFQAFERGAASVLPKPASPADPRGAGLVAEIRAVAEERREKHGEEEEEDGLLVPAPVGRVVRVVGIAASTGGPKALHELLGELGSRFSAPILVVQHMAEGFVPSLAHWLEQTVELPVEVASDGVEARPGTVYLAPCGAHLTVRPGPRIALSHAPPVGHHRPSGTSLFLSLARVDPGGAVGVLLTGMGRDGVEGLKVLHEKGGLVLAQSPESCVVSSMPRSAIEAGVVDEVAVPAALGRRLCRLLTGGRTGGGTGRRGEGVRMSHPGVGAAPEEEEHDDGSED